MLPAASPSFFNTRFFNMLTVVAAILFAAVTAMPRPALAQVTAFKQAVAETAARDEKLAGFYRSVDFAGIWTGNSQSDVDRRQALFMTMQEAGMHGLPAGHYQGDALRRMLETARTPRDLGRAEVEMSRAFLNLAHDMHTGVLRPREVDSGIKRDSHYRDDTYYLKGITQGNPRRFLRSLAPKTNEYARLMKEKLRLERVLSTGGWGPNVPVDRLEMGAQGPAVVTLRNRLVAMGFHDRSATRDYDADLQIAVQTFQATHGLEQDGVAGASTMTEINKPVEARLKSIMAAMERERWLNMPRGDRHILVNLTDFSARIVDDDEVTFQTRTVIGKNRRDQRTPEFSDEMAHLIINPYWHVPRSIVVNEYLPQMQRNPGAAGHLQLYNARGQRISRAQVNFNAYNARNFPFDMKQNPSRSNALGLVKFMFPNRYNIYLHDTPSKSLFQRNTRAFSHGCIRLQDPFDFAYAILARQERDPKAFFQRILKSGRNTQVNLDQKIPVHLIYRTAFTQAKGPVQYRKDIYGRDAKIWDGLARAGVSLHPVQG